MHLQLSPRESGSQGSAKSTTISKIKPTDPQRIRRQAKEHLDSKRPEQAIKLLESLLLENPTDKHAISLLIKAYDHEDRLEDAKTIFDIAERHRLLDGQIRYHMLKAHARAGEVDQAKEVFQAAVRKFEDSRQYYGIMLELFIENGRWKDAMECLKLANERGHAQPMHYSMMIGAARKTRDSAAVGKLVREAVSRDLTNGAVYSEVFNHYLELRDVRNAFRIFRRMKPLRKDGWDSPEPRKCIGDMFALCIEKGKKERAKEVMRLGLEHAMADVDMVGKIVEMQLQAKQLGKARRTLESAAERGVVYTAGYEEVVNEFRWKGMFSEVVSTLESAPAEAGASILVRLRNAEALTHTGENERAIEIAEALLSEEGIAEGAQTRALFIICVAKKNLGNAGEVLPVLETLYRNTAEGSLIFPEILCEMVDVWKRLRYPADFDIAGARQKVEEFLPAVEPCPFVAKRMKAAMKTIERGEGILSMSAAST